MYAVPNMAVFCSSLTLCSAGAFFECFMNGFEMVAVSRVITGIIFISTFLVRFISVVRSPYSKILSATFLITFQSPEISTSINTHVPFHYLGL